MERDRSDRPDRTQISGWRLSDTSLLTGLLLATVLFAVTMIDPAAPPYEDAAMLMRYAQNFAAGHGISWNPGEHPADGATDFLFMLALAGWCRAGQPVETGTRILGLVAHLVVVGLVFVFVRNRTEDRGTALVSGTFLALGPGVLYLQAHFGTPFFALGVLVHWCLALRAVDRPEDTGTLIATALTGVLLGVMRPEGILVAGFVLLALVFHLGWSRGKPVAVWFALAFLVPGVAYLLWRWRYFGTPLPTPLLIKGEQRLHWDSLCASIRCTVGLTLPFLLAFVPGLVDRATRRKTVFHLVPVVGMTAMWILLSNATNYFRRFQYPVLPMILVSWPLVWGATAEARQRWMARVGLQGRVARVVPLAALVLLAVGWSVRRGLPERQLSRDGRYEAGLALARFGADRVMATTEAGLLPLYSRWTAVDLYGLNDPVVARRGPAWDYLDARQPDLIVFYAYFAPGRPRGPGHYELSWFRLISSVQDYAESRGYLLAACYGPTREETHYYYVRSGARDRDELVRTLRGLDYRWWKDGRRCENFALPG
jgi:hypothetical protein